MLAAGHAHFATGILQVENHGTFRNIEDVGNVPAGFTLGRP